MEESAFSIAEARRILRVGQDLGLAAKLHADQLTSGGGAELAAELRALSADHLEHVSDRGIAAMASAGVVAVSLPLASLYLGQPAMPARRLIDAGVSVAVATDFNPGSAPSYHLPLALTLACTLQGMTPAEALKGATLWPQGRWAWQRRSAHWRSGKSGGLCRHRCPRRQSLDLPFPRQRLCHDCDQRHRRGGAMTRIIPPISLRSPTLRRTIHASGSPLGTRLGQNERTTGRAAGLSLR